jgi:hypothetical protein
VMLDPVDMPAHLLRVRLPNATVGGLAEQSE